jgi:predicted nucleic acid-binding protein
MAKTASALLDTSVIVHYLTGAPADLADRAAAILDGEADLGVTDVVIVETAYVLLSVYEVSRQEVVDHLIALLRKRNVHPIGLAGDRVLEALLLCRPSGRISFADAMTWAAARERKIPRIYTFDGRFPENGVELKA